MNDTKKILVISGGGFYGFSFLGVIDKLDKEKKLNNIHTYCGTSAGSILSLLLCIGYSAIQIYNVSLTIDFNKLYNYNDNFMDEIPFGLFLTNKLLDIIRKFLKFKNIDENITFGELFDITNKKLIITGVCLNDNTLHYFNHETHKNMKIMDAVSISIAIPLVFKPYEYEGKIWIDGGFINNFPINYFDDCLDDVIGICRFYDSINIDSFVDTKDYLLQILSCTFINMFKINIEKYKPYMIIIDCTENFVLIDKDTKEKLFNIGYNSF